MEDTNNMCVFEFFYLRQYLARKPLKTNKIRSGGKKKMIQKYQQNPTKSNNKNQQNPTKTHKFPQFPAKTNNKSPK